MKRMRFADLVSVCVLSIFALVFLVPLVWIFVSAFKVDMEINRAGGFLFLPQTWTAANFAEIFNPANRQLPVWHWFFNSFFVSVSHTLLSLLIYSMSAYAYAKMNFKWGNALFLLLLFLSAFPAVTNIIPLYQEMNILGWLNTPLALIVPGLAGVFPIFLIKQFMLSIPDSLCESARLDGAGEFRVFSLIIIPLIRPVLTVSALFAFTANWNDFLWPSIAVNNIDRLTLTAGLQLVKGVYGNQVARTSAIAVAAVLPMIILYLCTQKYFSRGISLSGGVKQ